MKQEVSAGGIVVRKPPHGWEVLLIRDMKGQWTFPKGLIENNENHRQAARREIAEEVGITDIEYMQELTPITYVYNREGFIKKTVHYLLFSSGGEERLKPQIEEGISEAQWTPLSRAIEIIGYPKTNVPVLKQVHQYLNAYGN